MPDRRFGSLVMEDAGQGPALVMLHGLGGSSNTFEPLLDGLTGWRILRPDLPGAGRSPLRPSVHRIEDLSHAITEALKAAGISRAVIAAHSMGTLLAQHMALTAPDRVTALILFGALTEPTEPARTGLQQRAAQAEREGMAGIADAVSTASLSPHTRSTNPAVRAYVRESLMRQPPQGYANHCRALSRATAFPVRRINCPVTLITGADDPVAPPAMAETLHRTIPHSQLHILPNVGHWAPLEAPADSRRLLHQALAATNTKEDTHA